MLRMLCCLTLAVSSCAFDSEHARDPETLYLFTSTMRPVHQCQLPVFWTVDPSVSRDLGAELAEGFESFEQTTGADLFFRIDYPHEMSLTEVEATGTIVVSMSAMLSHESAYGVTRLSYRESDGCIQSATIQLRDSLTTLPSSVRRAVMQHEIGHALGADHSSDAADLMFSATGGRDEARGLSPFEKAALTEMYRQP